MGQSQYGSSYGSPYGSPYGGGYGPSTYGMAYGQANPMQAFNASYGQPYGRYQQPMQQPMQQMGQPSPMQKSQPFMPGNVADTGNMISQGMGSQIGTQPRMSPAPTPLPMRPGTQPRVDPYAGGTVPADPDYGGLSQPMSQPMQQQPAMNKAMQTQNNQIPGYGPPESQGVPSTLDPTSMAWLIGALGGGNFGYAGRDIPSQQNAYQQYYNSSYGNQYTGPGGGGRNITPFNWDWNQGFPRG